MIPNVKPWCRAKVRQWARAMGSVHEFFLKFFFVLLIFTWMRGIHLVWCSDHVSSDVARIQLNNVSWFLLSEMPLESGGRAERFFARLAFINQKIPGGIWSASQKYRSPCPKGIGIYLPNGFSEERVRMNILSVLFERHWCVGLCFAQLTCTSMNNTWVSFGRKKERGNIDIHTYQLMELKHIKEFTALEVKD